MRLASILGPLVLWAAGAANAGCNVSSPGMAFGSYEPLNFSGKLASRDSLSDARISIVCSQMAAAGSFALALGPSPAGSGDRISTRYMSNAAGGPDMQFNIYTNPSTTTVWGDGNTGSLINGSIPAISFGSNTQSVTVYGRIPAGQSSLRAGAFSSELTMTLTYNP